MLANKSEITRLLLGERRLQMRAVDSDEYPRYAKSLQRLSGFELEVYNRRFVEGAPQEETLQQLESVSPD